MKNQIKLIISAKSILWRNHFTAPSYSLLTANAIIQYNARQDKTKKDKTRQDKTAQDKTRQDKTRQDKT